ncbi:MAG: hypothetical protein KatS3mg052_0470 [Candidatus Roseilinea sp.]|nr:MAG: hypothetical protein KatS3mg052_0470 [Candidatus Roseilinea sp.]
MSAAILTVRVRDHTRERVDKPLIGVAFYRADQRIRIAGPNNTMQPYKIPYIEGSGYVDYTIARLPFLPGEYVPDGSDLRLGRHLRYDYWNECARFTVLPGSTRERYGIIALEGQWHHAGFEDAGMNAPARTHERSNGAFEMMRPER